MEAGMDKDIPVGKAGRRCCPGEIHGCEYPVGLVGFTTNTGDYRDQAPMLVNIPLSDAGHLVKSRIAIMAARRLLTHAAPLLEEGHTGLPTHRFDLFDPFSRHRASARTALPAHDSPMNTTQICIRYGP